MSEQSTKDPAKPRIVSWIFTVFAAILGCAVAYFFVTSFWQHYFDPIPLNGNMTASVGNTLLGMLCCMPWLAIASVAVAINHRNLAAWVTLAGPPIVIVIGLLVCHVRADWKTTNVTIGPVQRYGTSPDNLKPGLRISTEKQTRRYGIGHRDRGIKDSLTAYKGRITYEGQLDMADDGTTFSAVFELRSPKPFNLHLDGLRNPNVTSGGIEVSLRSTLPAGSYEITFDADSRHGPATEQP